MKKISLTLIVAATIQTIAIPTLALAGDTHPAYKPASFSIKNNSNYTLQDGHYEYRGPGPGHYNAQVPELDEALPKTLAPGDEISFKLDIDKAFKEGHDLMIRYCYTFLTSVPRVDDCCDFLIDFSSSYEATGYYIMVVPSAYMASIGRGNKYIGCGAQASGEHDGVNHFIIG